MATMTRKTPHTAKPKWLRKRLPAGSAYESVRHLIGESRLHTVCQEARCPNMWECFARHTATFLILGDRCSRDCGFCSVAHGPAGPPDPDEPLRIAAAADRLKLDYLVITSVTRDDLPDYGARHFADTITAVRRQRPGTRVEVLIPDMMGDAAAIQIVLDANPDVLNHNLETVPRLYPEVRPRASYQRSLTVLETTRRIRPGIPTKSGLMLGLGEAPGEVRDTLKDLRAAGCRMLTLGQYLQPGSGQLPVQAYVTPEMFDHWKAVARELGFSAVASGPFVRSSFKAKEIFDENP